MKLELSHLCNYPMNENDGLLIQTCTRTSSAQGQKMGYKTGVMIGLSARTGIEILFDKDDFSDDYELSQVKPILRPLSDLSENININDKMFIPLVELAKIANVDTTKLVDFGATVDSFGVRFDVRNYEDEYTHEVFGYTKDLMMFGRHYRVFPHKEYMTDVHFVPNQYELFSKLFEWHFDVFELIPNNLAIDINTI